MQTLLNWLFFPCAYFRYVRDKERMLLFCMACMYKKNDDPTVWEVDSLTEVISDCLLLFHQNPNMFNGLPEVKKGLFWTRLISKFKLVEFPREEVRRFVDMYSTTKGVLDSIKKDNASLELDASVVYHAWNYVVRNSLFGWKVMAV